MGDTRFRAFISYSHADEEWGAWLQRSLERFRTPKDLARLIAAQGRPVRLAPVFRDREDLPVAGNLNEAIQKALADSEFQIVLCSPNAAKSRWVNEEIKLFNRLHGPGRTFAIIIAGEPGGGDKECFPPALRFRLDANGEPTPQPSEPLAADAREEGDGKRYALLKTAAGMLGVGLDDLVRREAKARARRMQAIAGGTSAIAGVMAFAAFFAINQRNEARAARGEAEDLIEFMLSDLADRLEPVGSLAILDEVGGKVLAYYDSQDLKSLDADALSRRARGLMQLGNVDQRRGDLDAAQKAFESAFASTEENLSRAPDNPDRIFDHAQSVFYVGAVASDRGDYDEAEARFQGYFDLAQRLITLDPASPKWRLEVTYSSNNLGSIKYNRGEYAAAIPFFKESAEARRLLSVESPGDRKLAFAHASALSWLAYAELAVGDYPAAIVTLTEQQAIYDRFDAGGDTLDYESLEKKITADRRLAEAHIALGALDAAQTSLSRAAAIGELLLAREPENQNSLANVGITARLMSYLSGLQGEVALERNYARRSLEIAQSVSIRNPDHVASKLNLGAALCRVIAADGGGADSEADALERLLSDPAFQGKGEDVDFTIAANLALAGRLRALGDSRAASAKAAEAIEKLGGRAAALSASSQQTYALLLLESGRRREAEGVAEQLYDRGVRHPELVKMRRQVEGAGRL